MLKPRDYVAMVEYLEYLTRAALASAAYELCGDDMDGASATLDDYLYMTGL